MKKIAIIENMEGLGRYFIRFLEGQYEIFSVWKTSEFPEQDFDAYIFTGDSNNISDGLLSFHKKEVEFIKSIWEDKKIFGSCFSHQLIGKIFGGEVKKRDKRFFGWNKIEIKEDNLIFDGLDNPAFFCVNGNEITKKPKQAKILATNHDCRYQILQYGQNTITCQSHPEILKEDALRIIKEYKPQLMDRCENLDEIVEKTKGFSDDNASRIFLLNVISWLLS